MQKVELSKMIMTLFALKGKTGYTDFDVEAWAEALKEYPKEQLETAFKACIQKPGFFEIKMVLDELQPNNQDLAIDEWDKCMQVAKDGGRGFDLLSDATKRALRAAGGLQQLRVTESEYTKNKMRENFIQVFDTSKTQIGFDNRQATELLEELSERRKLAN
jgi:hypothetical protein